MVSIRRNFTNNSLNGFGAFALATDEAFGRAPELLTGHNI
jgi:hypothetical protein